MSKDLIQKVEECRNEFDRVLSGADESAKSDIKNKYLSRNGLVSGLMKQMGSLSKEEKPVCGKLINELKHYIQKQLSSSSNTSQNNSLEDLSLEGKKNRCGGFHPLTLVLEEVCELFEKMGFIICEGPEIESDYNNFTALNIPLDHPARDMHDTFYFDQKTLLRTHTSPVQIRVMKTQKPPLRIIAPGKVFRKDSDVTHSPMFHQIEGLYIDEDVNFGHLKTILTEFAKNIFDDSVSVRFRPSFFPFTEPSAEVDISCVMCQGKGCRVCSHTGWLEILGSGMVDPNVLEHVGIDSQKYSGYAFGLGVERIAMLKYSIDDIRLFYENNMSFLTQFSHGVI